MLKLDNISSIIQVLIDYGESTVQRLWMQYLVHIHGDCQVAYYFYLFINYCKWCVNFKILSILVNFIHT